MGDIILQKNLKVSAYSGYKMNERPLYFILNERKFMVNQIVDSWRDPDHDCFKVKSDDKKEYILKWNRMLDQWFLD